MDLDTEKQLVEKAKESLQAFDDLYEHYLPKIYSYILNRVANKEVAEDITSKTFIKAMTKIQNFKYKGFTFGAWLYKIAHNNLIDYYRKNKKTQVDIEVIKDTIGVDGNQEAIERQAIIIEALAKLPPKQQQMLSLRFFEEFSNQELADLLGCSKNSATVGVHRATKALEKVLLKMGYSNFI